MFKRSFTIKTNAVAALSGNIWGAMLSIIAVPYYLAYLGIESYGLIGVFTTLQSFIVLLDFGLSSTINRELARLSGVRDGDQEMHNIARTLSIPNWITAFGIAVLLCSLAPVIARYWIQPNKLSVVTVTEALMIIGVNIAIQFSINFYIGGLMGLQKQVILSFVGGICATLRTVGALVIIAFISPTIEAFLMWQTAVLVIQISLLAVTLRRSLPEGHKGHFEKPLFKKIWRFAAGVTSISIVSLILTQTDKVVLSRMLDLEHFGYYMLAVTISSTAIAMFVGPLTHAVYPQFSRLVGADNLSALREFYHRSCQTIAAIVFPVTSILVIFPFQVLFVWTGDREIASNSYIVLSLIALGTGLNAAMWLPHFLQLAHGWTSLIFKVGILLVALITPATIAGAYFYGAIGGAAGWAALTILFIPIMVHMMHRRILQGERLKWYLEDFILPLVTAAVVASAIRFLMPELRSRVEVLVELLIASILTLTITVLATRATRNQVKLLSARMLRASA